MKAITKLLHRLTNGKVLASLAVLAILIALLYFQKAAEPSNFRIFVESKSGRPILKDDCIVVFEKRSELSWAIPSPERGIPLSPKIIGIVPYHDSLIAPQIFNRGFRYGPAIYVELYLKILAKGHRASYFKLMRVSPDVEYHEKPSKTGRPWEDGYIGATYRIEPTTSEIDIRKNIDEINRYIKMDLRGETARVCRDLIDAEEERLKRLMDKPYHHQEEEENKHS